ncbi:TonB-linked outer membrane protein, SusC/RagA family [Chitinophaga costaii]|uniref:TonB-linked outer membrane protein, SusC/RagA family n=1 Tax=Chitinophaga costaii TaxID=1335309 RepID=A0A1C4C0Z0_9BACT|nr:SusC/RagA family TonB-linked outer membrane protein [Chitinophaga costaii]PUZ27382.1 SusC/RagA family TonB-linked outer membrane protein [Chitinophaga costaii]SCC12765.1 TonB-linked outer membrane protein, SusC/RagA family [Chitinophaga costaii]
MKRALLFFTMLMVAATMVYAQQHQVSGKVTGSDGAAVPLATVQVKGTTTGTTADANGVFTLTVNPSDILVIRSVGFQSQEVRVGNGGTLNVILTPDNASLQEVVVTALGIRRNKNELPYAAQTVTAEELNRTRDANVTNSLSGKVSGLEIRRNNSLGGSTNIVLRGNKSLTNDNQAMFVVDGVPIDNANTNNHDSRTGAGGYDYGNAAADINPDDIESVNVLKGAAASALYGSRAANGVIMITTKKAAKGVGVTINSGVTKGYIDKSTLPKYQHEYGAGYGDYFDYGADDVPIVPMYDDASLGHKFDPSMQVYTWESFDPTDKNYGKSVPWVAASHGPNSFYLNPTSTNNSVTINSGGEKGYFKLGYTKSIEDGILPNSQLKKDLVNFGASYDVTDKLTASANANFTRQTGLGRYGTGYGLNNVSSNLRQWWEMNTDLKSQKDAYFRTKQNDTWNRNGADDPVPAYWDNPYFVRYENYENDSRNRIFGNVALNYKFAPWFSVMGRVSVDHYNEIQEERIAKGSINVSQYQRFNHEYNEYNYDLLLNFQHTFASGLSLKGLIGGNVRRNTQSSILASTNGGLLIDRLYSLTNTANPMQAPTETDSTFEVDGIFASGTVGWKDLLFLDITGRRDKASTLPANNNTYYYPSASLGFVFSKLMPSATWLSYGKLRANIAEVGNSGTPYLIQDYYDVPTGINGTPLASVRNTKNNPDLKPERTISHEFGLEAAFLNNRVGFDFSYYNQRSIDQIVPLPVSNATGYTYKVINAGTIVNKGIELSAYVTPVKTKDFSWTLNLNFARNRNRVTELNGTDVLQLLDAQGGVTINATKGEAYGNIRGTDYVYLNGQREVDEDGHYVFTSTSNNTIGNVSPDWIGGVSNTLKYKNLSLSFLIDIKHGGDVFSLDMYYGLATGLYQETAGLNELGGEKRGDPNSNGGVLNKGVTADGKPNTKRITYADYGEAGYYYNPDKAFVYDASYVKLREVALTFSLPSKWLSHVNAFKGIDISLLGRNLWIIHKNLPYSDPEDGLGSGNLQGYQVGAYPTTRNIGFNVKLRF